MKKYLSILLCLLTVLFSFGCEIVPTDEKVQIITDSELESYGLRVHFIDIGQGDCTLIESKGRFALVDAGEYAEATNAVNYLSSLGVESLDYLIATHPHSDHCGGMPLFMENFSCSTLLFPETDVDTNLWYNVLDTADERGVLCQVPEPYEVYTLGDATITILSPQKNSIYANLNNYSIVCMVEYKDTSVLLMGDAEKLIERDLIKTDYNLSADVLKLGHHGSSTSTCEEFLNEVNPSVAVISCGFDNDYGHPHEEPIAALKARNIPYYQTAEDGTVVISSDGEKLSLSTKSESQMSITTSPTSPEETLYIGNKNSKIFHSQYCESVENTKEKNKVYFSERDNAINEGYSPCKGCKP